MRHTLGTLLSLADQRKALARYTERYTAEHKPAWVRKDPAARVQFSSYADWLAHTMFPVCKDNSLAARGNCESYPTWPDNPELRKGHLLRGGALNR